jgi:hypothetical protein
MSMADPLYVSHTLLNRNISREEVVRVVSRAKRGKAVGIDGLPNEVLKVEGVIDALCSLFQLCFDSGKVPDEWCKAIINPILKSRDNDRRLPMSYRGISLLPHVAKLYTSLLNKRVSNVVETDILMEEQNGFRPKRSCVDHVFVVNSFVQNRLIQKKSAFAAFIDLKKAFDYVDRDMLLFKLHEIGIDGKLYFAIKALYSDTVSTVRLNGYHSPWFKTNYGVRQGDSLSPTLFAIYINDLVHELNEQGVGLDVDGRNVSSLLYADDIIIFAENEEKLQILLTTLHNWCQQWRLVVNQTKSSIVHFREYCRT